MITIRYGNLKRKLGVLWAALEYITNPFLVLLCGFAQYETERLQ
jgi:hypothetical protein